VSDTTVLRIGDHVRMIHCDGATGIVVGFSRNKVMVRFSDMDSATWILRPKSLQIVARKEE
jgi:hypothetical protein